MKNITASTTMQGLLAAASPLVMSWISWSKLAPEDKTILIVGSLGWLWAAWGRWKQGDLEALAKPKPEEAAVVPPPEQK